MPNLGFHFFLLLNCCHFQSSQPVARRDHKREMIAQRNSRLKDASCQPTAGSILQKHHQPTTSPFAPHLSFHLWLMPKTLPTHCHSVNLEGKPGKKYDNEMMGFYVRRQKVVKKKV
jgi:hypothetical protein